MILRSARLLASFQPELLPQRIAVRRWSVRAVLLIQVRSTYRNRSCETK
jgi:hypothetical protein